ncbi:MAG: 50S ribosomal protein L15 [Candidatus Pacebacteria bacterium]|nr:50S ribosomal protein L15 [Candidatus Paceibacterota bacterium]
MKLHELRNVSKRKARKRVGRGDSSDYGRTSGRGEKGAGARSGYSHRAYFEGGQLPFFRRLPKRGFKNPNHRVYSVINVGRLEESFAAGEEVNKETLRAKGLLGKKVLDGVKILGDGDLTKALTVTADKFSEAARAKIEGAGGECQSA